MAIYNLYLDLENDYINLIKDIYKTLIILIVFQGILYYGNVQKNIVSSALTGHLLNDEFMMLLMVVIISFSAYYLVFERILEIK